MSIDASRKKSKKSRRGKKSTKISFDAELITKDKAKGIASEQNNERVLQTEPQLEHAEEIAPKASLEEDTIEIKPEKKIARPKKNKKRPLSTAKEDGGDENQSNTEEKQTTNTESNTNSSKTEESIRAKKRRKHAELLKNKKIQAELNLQQKGLNYLSRWKHNRPEWKFEKLRQIWLQQNIFDDAKIPEEFWETLVEYFGGARGKIKEVVVNEAIKIIEDIGDKGELEIDDDMKVKLKRARSVVQNLQ